MMVVLIHHLPGLLNRSSELSGVLGQSVIFHNGVARRRASRRTAEAAVTHLAASLKSDTGAMETSA